MAKTEDIEAKLAAFVDGELDQAGCVEIEQHLATHPAHRQLMEELIRQRDLLRGLPREAAPADFADSINAQLERAVLLGDVDSEVEAVAGRIGGNWSRFRAIAAVLLLTASLTAVIMSLLPSLNQRSSDLVAVGIHPPTTAENELESGTLKTTTEQDAFAPRTVVAAQTEQQDRAVRALTDRNATEVSVATASKTNPSQVAVEIASRPVLQLGNSPDTVSRIYNEVLQPRLRASSPGDATPYVYVIPTNNPDAANRAVTKYLLNNNIRWESHTEPLSTVSQPARQQVMYGSKLQQQSVQMKQSDSAGQVLSISSAPPSAQAQATPSTVPSESESPPKGVWTASAGPAPMQQNAYQPQRIIAKQVTLPQAAELRAALEVIQNQVRTGSEPQETLSMAVGPTNSLPPNSNSFLQSNSDQSASNVGGIDQLGRFAANSSPVNGNAAQQAQSQVPKPSDETNSALADKSVAVSNGQSGAGSASVNSNLAFAPFRLDAPGVELNDHPSNASPTTSPVMQIASGATTQPQIAAGDVLSTNAVPPADTERVDFVIVLQPQLEVSAPSPEVSPATQPATQPALQFETTAPSMP